MDKILHDNELGTITIRTSTRCKNYTLKVSNGKILATIPEHGGNEKKMLDFINEKRDKLIQLLEKNPPRPLLDETSDLQTATFRMRILREDRKNIHTRLKDELLTITCPVDIDIKEERIQTILLEIVENVFRHEAKRVLPGRTVQLAEKFGFSFSEVKINNSKTHWGSCTSRKNINLSLYLMKLPWYLIDYVLLHELCHTREMNHSKRFWNLMNQVTEGKAISLRQELKSFHIP